MRLRRNGETNPATYLVLAVLAVAGWYVYTISPVYLDNLKVKELCEQAMNQAFIDGEAAARDQLLFRLGALPGTHFEVDDDGNEKEMPGLGILPENVNFIFENDNKKLTVRVEYDRIIQYKPLKKRKKFHVIAEKTGNRK